MTKIIALVGPKQSGKTTLAILLESFGYENTTFAGPLKAMLRALLEYQNIPSDEITRMLNGDLKEKETPYLSYKTPRYAMQTLGTEWRNLISQNLWIDIWEYYISDKPKVVVSDCRFHHEANRVKRLGGTIVKINRPNLVSSDNHISETEMQNIKCDVLIENTRNPNYMLDQLNHFL